jgi:hypothetical protein
MGFGGGVVRYQPGSNSVIDYSNDVFGDAAGETIGNVQSAGSGSSRKMIVSFRALPLRGVGNPIHTPINVNGAVGIYTGK